MVMNIILFATMYPTMFIMYFIMKNLAFSNKKLVFGVHISQELRDSDMIQEIAKSYHIQMRLGFFFIFLTPALFFLSHHVSIQFTLWMIWFLGALGLMNVPYILANKKVATLKKESINTDAVEEKSKADSTTTQSVHRPAPASRATRYVELSRVRKVRLMEFLPQLLLSIATAIFMLCIKYIMNFDQIHLDRLEVFRFTIVVLAALTPLFYLLAVWMDRMPLTVINSDSEINLNYNRAKKNLWKNFWKINAWINTLLTMLLAIASLLDFHGLFFLMLAAGLEAIAAIYLMLDLSRKLNEINKAYSDNIDPAFDPDDDRYWIWGMFYNNPMDKRTMVEKRFGIGTTTNMATRTGKATIWIAILSLIWIPIMCVWMILDDFTPMHLVCSDTALVCEHVKTDYSIPYDEILSVSLLEELPKNRAKMSGTGTDTCEKGRYSASDFGSYISFLNPEEELFLRVDTKDHIYLLCGNTEEETRRIYESLQAGK